MSPCGVKAAAAFDNLENDSNNSAFDAEGNDIGNPDIC